MDKSKGVLQKKVTSEGLIPDESVAGGNRWPWAPSTLGMTFLEEMVTTAVCASASSGRHLEEVFRHNPDFQSPRVRLCEARTSK